MNGEVVRSHTGGNLRKEHCNCSIFHSRVYIWVPFCPNFVHVFVRVYLSPTPELCPLSSVLAWGGGCLLLAGLFPLPDSGQGAERSIEKGGGKEAGSAMQGSPGTGA